MDSSITHMALSRKLHHSTLHPSPLHPLNLHHSTLHASPTHPYTPPFTLSPPPTPFSPPPPPPSFSSLILFFLSSRAHLESPIDYCEQGVREGARVVYEGRRIGLTRFPYVCGCSNFIIPSVCVLCVSLEVTLALRIHHVL